MVYAHDVQQYNPFCRQDIVKPVFNGAANISDSMLSVGEVFCLLMNRVSVYPRLTDANAFTDVVVSDTQTPVSPKETDLEEDR